MQSRHPVLLIDDHPLVRVGMAALIGAETDLIVCGQAGTARAALDLVRETHPAVVILDLNLPDGGGLDLVERIANAADAPRVIVCSVHDAALFAPRALAAGAQGYLHKEEASAQLITAIRRVLAGNVYLGSAATQTMLRRLAGERAHPNSPLLVAELSNRELEVFRLMGDFLGTSQIAARLNLSVKTIETHRAHIKRKLHLATTSDLTRHAVQWVMEQNGGAVATESLGSETPPPDDG